MENLNLETSIEQGHILPETLAKRVAASAEQELPLPELALREVVRSPEPIDQEGGQRKKIEALKPWKNYTILSIENDDTIRLYDEHARRVERFTESKNKKTILVRWDAIVKKAKKLYFGYEESGRWSKEVVLTPSELPPKLREASRVLDDESRRASIALDLAALSVKSCKINVNLKDLQSIQNGKYLLDIDRGSELFIGFITENESGIMQAPWNWRRVDSFSQDIPPDLAEYVTQHLKLSGGIRELALPAYKAVVTEVGINIVASENVNGNPVLSDNIPSIENNVASDPINPNVVYYCQSGNTRDMVRLNMAGEPNTWRPVTAEFPKKYDSVHDLQLDPGGNFFLFYAKEDLVIVTKDTLEEVKRVPGMTRVNFDAEGNIRAVDKDGHLVIYEPQFTELAKEMDTRRVQKLSEDINVADIFDLKVQKKAEAAKSGESMRHLEVLREKYAAQFQDVLGRVTTMEGVGQLRNGLKKLRDQLHINGLKPSEVDFVAESLRAPIEAKEKEFGAIEAKKILAGVRAKLAAGLSLASVSEARSAMAELKVIEGLLDDPARREVGEASQELDEKSLELFRQRGGEIIKDVQGLIGRTRADLEGYASKAQMDDWLEFRFPQLKARLGGLAHDCPLEADEAYKAIIAARAELQELASSFEEKFKREYAKVREKAAARMEATVDTLEQDLAGLIDRVRSKGFADRKAAEQYLETSQARRTLEEEIAALAGQNPDVAKELERALKVKLSNTLTEIERGAMTKVAETGQQMVALGKTLFPKWEARVTEKEARKGELVFAEDVKTHGPGVKAGDILGDAALAMQTPDGRTETVRLYAGWEDEQEWRLGLQSYRGEAIPPSYVSAAEFKAVKKEYADWSLGGKSKLRKEVEEKRNELKKIYGERAKIGKREGKKELTAFGTEYYPGGSEVKKEWKNYKETGDELWKKKYKEALATYAKFCAEHHIPLLRRIDRVKNEPDIEESNGKGFVPEWQSHWVMDRQTEADLEEMANAFKMQLDLQEGMLNLKGHAGTGKDVRLKMFCALTGRPYFGFDCTKWTTEFELSEDVMLEAESGASYTIKVPSIILSGVTTPGAVVYFNEYNAMPEQAQIFLHALTDEKRSLTLKTSSGKTVKAHPSVLLASSMNPDYPGTFKPQFATRSRTVSLEVDYPPLTRKPDAGDRNTNPLFDASEPLRIARGTDSLADLTYEASLERNEFVQVWDHYVNGIENGATDPSGTKKFDMDVILALVQFGNKLREDFIKIFEQTRAARNALPVNQPLTGREFRRCAYALSKMTPEEKTKANPEKVAKDLLEKFFLTHIDKSEDREKIRTAMTNWTSQKRVRA